MHVNLFYSSIYSSNAMYIHIFFQTVSALLSFLLPFSNFLNLLYHREENNLTFCRQFNPLLMIDWLFYLTPIGRREIKCLNILKSFTTCFQNLGLLDGSVTWFVVYWRKIQLSTLVLKMYNLKSMTTSFENLGLLDCSVT